MTAAPSSAEPTRESLMADVRRICALGWRRNGSPAARAAARLFRDEFEHHGLTTTVETWPFNLYYPQDWSVSVVATGDASGLALSSSSTIPIWYSAEGEAEGELVAVDARAGVLDLADRSLVGKVLLVDVEHVGNFLPTDGSSTRDAGLYAAAVAAGAVGYLRKSGAPDNQPMLMHLAQNFPTHLSGAQLGAVPAFTVGREDFAALQRLVDAGPTTVRLQTVLTAVEKGGERRVLNGALGPGAHLLQAVVDDVIGILPGMSAEIVVVGCHYDSTFEGAVDNATGNAVLLALLRHYASLAVEDRAKTLVFLASGAHDTGDFDLYHFVEQHQDDLLPRVVAFDWLDHMAADPRAAPAGSSVSRGLIASENSALRAVLMDAITAHGLTVQQTLPPMSTISHLPAYVPAYNLTLAPSWYHSPIDTVETVAADDLLVMAQAQRQVLDALLAGDGATMRAQNPVVRALPTTLHR